MKYHIGQRVIANVGHNNSEAINGTIVALESFNDEGYPVEDKANPIPERHGLIRWAIQHNDEFAVNPAYVVQGHVRAADPAEFIINTCDDLLN